VIIHKFLGSSLTCGIDSDSDQLYPRVTVDKLSDDVLLEIFVCLTCQLKPEWLIAFEDGWRTLVHVCKRWRSVVFSSPRRLDLQLFCTNTRPVKKLLDIWPPLPIYIFASLVWTSPMRSVTNLMAGLEQQNRVTNISISGFLDSILKRSVAMKPYPALTRLDLSSNDAKALVLPDSFLGGSAPRLREIWLSNIPFPGIGKLLLSTTDLGRLSLYDIPHSGIIPPEAMVANLSTLTRLEQLCLQFRSPRPRADREHRHPPPLTHVVLPALTRLWFKGDSEYVEDILSRVDAPLLNIMDITFFNQLVFDTPQLSHFISRVGTSRPPDCAPIFFNHGHVTVQLFRSLSLCILCEPSDWQLSSLSQLCNSALSPLLTPERLKIYNRRMSWEDDMESVQWLEFLQLFPSVKELVLSAKSFQLVAPTLNELDITVLPAIQTIAIQGPQSSEPDIKAIGTFISTHQLLGRPVTTQCRDGEDLDV
jgi:hypothetical protein